MGAARKDLPAGERFGESPLAAEHPPLRASRNASQVFGFSDSPCVASERLLHDSYLEAGSTAGRAAASAHQEHSGSSAGSNPEPLVSHPCDGGTRSERDRSTGAGVPGGPRSPSFMRSVREAESLQQHLLPLVRGMETGRPQHRLLPTTAPPALPFPDTQPKRSRSSSGAATADGSSSCRSHAAGSKRARRRRTQHVPWVETCWPNQPSPAQPAGT